MCRGASRLKTLNPTNPAHLWRLKGELWSYSKWKLGQAFAGTDRQSVAGLASVSVMGCG